MSPDTEPDDGTTIAKAVCSLEFLARLRCEYYPALLVLDFRVLTRSGMFSRVWPTATRIAPRRFPPSGLALVGAREFAKSRDACMHVGDVRTHMGLAARWVPWYGSMTFVL